EPAFWWRKARSKAEKRCGATTVISCPVLCGILSLSRAGLCAKIFAPPKQLLSLLYEALPSGIFQGRFYEKTCQAWACISFFPILSRFFGGGFDATEPRRYDHAGNQQRARSDESAGQYELDRGQ